MPCDAITKDLKPLLDGELSRLRAWRVRRHIADCAECEKEWKAIQRLDTLLRGADLFAPEPPPVPAPRRPKTALRLAAVAAALLIAALLLLPALKRQPRNMAAAVAAALGLVNTWHFSGWKLMDGKRVPWEVWGRRHPFLYYERVGDEITMDDGRQRLRIYPPNPGLLRPTGLVVRTESTRDPKNKMAGAWFLDQNNLDLLARAEGGGLLPPRPLQQTAAQAVFRQQYPLGVGYGVNANQLYTVSKRTWLPVQYRLQFSTAAFKRDGEFLKAVYAVPLPESVVAPAIPPDYSRADFTQGGAGLAVQTAVSGTDGAGNILVRASGRLGSVVIRPDSTFTMAVSAADSHPVGLRNGERFRYLPMDVNGFQYTSPNGDALLWLAPLEPPAGSAALPNKLRLRLTFSLDVLIRGTDFVDARGVTYPRSQSQALLTDGKQWTLVLPDKPTVQALANSPAWPGPWSNRMFSLAYYLDQARAGYYYLAQDYQNQVLRRLAPDLVRQGLINPDGSINPAKPVPVQRLNALYDRHRAEFRRAQRQQRARAAYWLSRQVDTIPSNGNGWWMRLLTMQTLAKYQQDAGQIGRSRRTLKEILRASEERPQAVGLLRRQAEYALRTGQFPPDAGYKGPS